MTKRTPEKRLKAHLSEAKSQSYNMYLHNAIRKHGPEVFSILVIEECSKEQAPERERYWIKNLNTIQPNGYNEHEGGQGGCLNASPELRKKLSEVRKKLFANGYIPWNKGKTNLPPPWNKGKIGVQKGWNTGLTKESDARVAANSLAISKATKGIPKTENWKAANRKHKK